MYSEVLLLRLFGGVLFWSRRKETLHGCGFERERCCCSRQRDPNRPSKRQRRPRLDPICHWLTRSRRPRWPRSIFFSMHQFTRLEEEPEPQASGSRLEPPRKCTAVGLLDSRHLPPIRPKCFGCSRRLELTEISQHILNCDRVLVEHLVRFQTALGEFRANPGRAGEVFEAFLNRVRMAQ